MNQNERCSHSLSEVSKPNPIRALKSGIKKQFKSCSINFESSQSLSWDDFPRREWLRYSFRSRFAFVGTSGVVRRSDQITSFGRRLGVTRDNAKNRRCPALNWAVKWRKGILTLSIDFFFSWNQLATDFLSTVRRLAWVGDFSFLDLPL